MKTSTAEVLNNFLERYPQLDGIKENITGSVDLAIKTFKGGNKLLVCGNGGSSADSDHIVGELMKYFALRRELTDRQKDMISACVPEHAQYLNTHLQQAIPAISLSAHTALYTAFANDTDTDLVFAQQVFGYGKPGDLLLAVSTSGVSKNVIYAAEIAKAFGLSIIALTGESGGDLKDICDVLVNVPETVTYKVQELHLPYYHAFCMAVENEFFGE